MAARVDANINKETLSFICSQIGVSTDYLSQRTNQDKSKILAWINATDPSLPTLIQAKSIATILRVPFAALYMDKDKLPIKKLPKLRNLRSMLYDAPKDDSSLNLAIADLIRYHDFLISTDTELEIAPPLFTLPVIAESAGVIDYAKVIREFFRLELNAQYKLTSSRQFYLYVRQQIERKGIFIHSFTGVDVEVARGVAVFNETTPIIGINDNDRYPAKTFSIIHELVHIMKRQSTMCNEMFASFSNQSEEVFCNAVAGEVLVPTSALETIILSFKINSFDLHVIETLANKFNISKEVITRRLYDTNRFSKDEYNTFTNEIRDVFIQEREKLNAEKQQGIDTGFRKNISMAAVDKTSPAICRVLLLGYSDGYFNKQDVSGLLGIKEKHVPKFFAEVRKW